MNQDLQFVPASAFSLDALAEIFTRSFEGYFYPATVTAALLSQRMRAENLDLARSLVLMSGGEAQGIALLGLRAERAWCGGFGVASAARGRGYSHRLAAAMIEQARQAGARELSLEVLTRNAPAIKTDLRAGMQVRRDLRVLEWKRGEAEPARDPAEMPSAAWQPRQLLSLFDRLHPMPAAWQRDLPALLVRAGMQSLAVATDDQPSAYALFNAGPDGRIQLADLAARQASEARVLLAALRAGAAQIVSVNEPAESPLMPAFEELGFAEIDRQLELVLELA
jgi:RimJ/RimL family protein N-acetyltransferase